eukprot:jgi/Bigna1/127366/aug1.4_g2074
MCPNSPTTYHHITTAMATGEEPAKPKPSSLAKSEEKEDLVTGTDSKTKEGEENPAGKSNTSKKRKKKKKKRKRNAKLSASGLPSAADLLGSVDVPEFLEKKLKEDKTARFEARLEAEEERKKDLEAQITMMEEANERQAQIDLEHEEATTAYKVSREGVRNNQGQEAQSSQNCMNRMSIHKFH